MSLRFFLHAEIFQFFVFGIFFVFWFYLFYHYFAVYIVWHKLVIYLITKINFRYLLFLTCCNSIFLFVALKIYFFWFPMLLKYVYIFQ